MEKKKKTRFIVGWLLITAALLAGSLLVPGHGKSEAAQEAMRDAVLHGTNRISLFGLKDVNPAYISSLVVVGALLLAAILLRVCGIPRFKMVPGKLQMALETVVGLFDWMAKGNSPHRNKFLGAYIFGAGVYIFVGTLFELLGLQAVTTTGRSVTLPAPLSDVNGAIALGCLSYLVILSGGIDLSVGSVSAFTGVFLAKVIGDFGISPLLAFPLVLLMGCAFGAFMGLLIDALKIPAFIITLAGMFFLRGVSYLVSEESIPINHPIYDTLSSLAWKIPGGGRLSAMGLLMLAVVVIGIFLAHRTRFGNQVYAIGGNATSANLMGISTRSTTIRIYMLSTGLATLAGIVFSIYTQAGYALAGVGVELDAIASVVIGGTLLSGGVGTVLGTLFGVAIQGLIQAFINFDGTLSSWWTKIAIGILLFIFIALQRGLTVLWENRQSAPVTRVNIAQR